MNINDFIEFLNEDLLGATDSLMRRLSIECHENKVVLEFSAGSFSHKDWINVELTLIDVSEFNIKSRSFYDLELMSSGMRILKDEDKYFIDFSIDSGRGVGIERYKNSLVYFAFRDCTYIIKEYQE